jgi:hypothetical protein
VRYISYSETAFATDELVADRLLAYATILARSSSADTVVVPGRIGDGAVEPVSVLIGPASQITSWSDDEPFGEDVGEAVADLDRRIREVSAGGIVPSGEIPPGGIDEFDDLA